MNRRGISVVGWVLTSAFFLSLPAQAAETVVKVGFLTTFSGQGASLGEAMDRAVKLYVKEHEKELGDIKLEIIRRDDTGPNPDTARRLAQELITRDHVDLITGLIYTPNAIALAPLATDAKVPVVIMNAATSSILTRSPYMVRVSFTLWQECFPFGQWVAKQGIKRAYVAVSDYAPGHDAEAAFTKGFTGAGGTVVGSVRLPLGTNDFTPYLQRIKDEKPEALFVFVPGGKDSANLMKSYSEVGLAQVGVKLFGAGDMVSDDEIFTMTGVPEGAVTMHYYSAAATRPQNKALLAAWHRDYGADSLPNPVSIGAWDAMAAIFAVVKAENGKLDPERTMELLKHWQNPDSPRGPIAVDPATRNVVENMYVRRLQRVDGHLANVEIETVPMVKDPWYEFNMAK